MIKNKLTKKDLKNVKGIKKEKKESIAREEQDNKKNNEKINSKDKLYYVYIMAVIGIIFILIAVNSSRNGINNSCKSVDSKEKNIMKSNIKTDVKNRKKVTKKEKSEETLSKNVKSVENNHDSQKLKDKEVGESKKVGSSDKKVVYLTFDDGPSENTTKILSILDKYDAKATFFVIYSPGKKNKAIYKRIVDEGHTIGVHSYTHNYNQIYKSKKAFKNDIVKMKNYIFDVTGVETKIYRFPGGSGNKVSKIKIKDCVKILKKESMIYFDWNVMNGDATGKKLSDKQLINNVVNNVDDKNTPIVLMHDSAAKTNTVKTLPKIITKLRKKGYEFAAINEETPRIQQYK